MRLIHTQCGGAIVVDRGARQHIVERSTRPGATGSDIYVTLRCSFCGERLGEVPNVETA